MRKREEVLNDFNYGDGIDNQRLILEVLLDVRDKLGDIYMAVPEVSDIKDAIHKPGYHLKQS